MVSDNKIEDITGIQDWINRCYDCHKELEGTNKTRCSRCLILDSLRHIKRRGIFKGRLCLECFTPISAESNGEFLVCINCRLLRDMRRI